MSSPVKKNGIRLIIDHVFQYLAHVFSIGFEQKLKDDPARQLMMYAALLLQEFRHVLFTVSSDKWCGVAFIH